MQELLLWECRILLGAAEMFMLIARIVVKVTVCLCWFPVDINVQFFIFLCNDGVKECTFSIVFML